MSTVPGVQRSPIEAVSRSLYQTIYVPVDNSPYSNRAVDCAIELGRNFNSSMVGSHVYAARMHDYRFKQMEYTLPEEYLEEQELERQRKIHDSLITMGLELISDCYLEDMSRKCQEAGLTCERRMMDGKHSIEILRDLEANSYDLVVMGALGIGKVRDSVIGSVCERVTRHAEKTDVWVVKHLPGENEERDTILVGIDGSPQSFGALRTGIELARRFGKKLELISVYDPYLHYAVFKGIVDVLTEKASKVFRFEEQNQLHEEIIDTGLAQIYQSHLDVARNIAVSAGLEVNTTLLDGKAFQKVLDHCRKVEPWVLIMGRLGVHSEQGQTGLGSNSENLLRCVPCDVLLTTRLEYPELDLKAEASIHWTPEAEERMGRVPDMVKGIARTAILRLAIEKGHSVVTSALVTEAMDRFMPKQTSLTTTRLAERLAIEHARENSVSVCRKCGVAAKVVDPVQCSVCGGTDFEVVTQEMVERIAAVEGGIEEETTYDGRKVKWTQEARRLLHSVEDRYQMRRCKARIEKKARMQRLETITVDFARSVVAEETGESFFAPGTEENKPVAAALAEKPRVEEAAGKVLATDSKGAPLVSEFQWTDDAAQRVLRVPAGFMRAKTQERIEQLAAERKLDLIDLQTVEDGIEIGRQMMAQMIGQYSAPAKPAAEATEECPVPESERQADSESPEGRPKQGLNETGWMSEMARRREKLIE